MAGRLAQICGRAKKGNGVAFGKDARRGAEKKNLTQRRKGAKKKVRAERPHISATLCFVQRLIGKAALRQTWHLGAFAPLREIFLLCALCGLCAN
jgi:hypothetical protein